MRITESIDEAFMKNHLVISLYYALALKVRGIEFGLCPTSRSI